MELDITEFLPELNEITAEKYASVFDRMRFQLQEDYAELKTNPNSGYGNLFVKPHATVVAAYEEAMNRVLSDLTLDNVAEGTIYSCDFVRDNLKNYGVSADEAVPAIGTVKMSFSTNERFLIDRGSRVLFNNNDIYYFVLPSTSDIVIAPVGSAREEGNWYELVQTATNEYSVHLPVIGGLGSVVTKGSSAQVDFTISALTSVTAVADFDTGRMPETLPEMAVMAKDISYAASFASRAGAKSFIKRKFPNILGVTPVLNTDVEMTRDKQGILGISRPAMDVYVKGTMEPQTNTVFVNLFKTTGNNYQGLLRTPDNAPVYLKSVTYGGNPVSSYEVIGAPRDPSVNNNAAVAFSTEELLGLNVDAVGVQNVSATPVNIIKNGTVAQYPTIKKTSGYFKGYLFDNKTNVQLKLQAAGTAVIGGETYGVLTGKDEISQEELPTIYVKRNAAKNVGEIDFDVSGPAVKKFFNGVTIEFETTSGDFVVTNASDFIGESFEIAYGAEYATFQVDYIFDSAVKVVDDILKSPYVQPVNDVVIKAFHPCYISEFVVKYRRKTGSNVDKTFIKQKVYEYLNSLSYEDVYESSRIGDIVLYAGATGLSSIEATGSIFHSIASKYSTDGFDNPVNFKPVDPINLLEFNETYRDTKLDSVVSLKNIQYIVESVDNIVVKEVAF
jgi:hypothetical protein